MYKDCRNAVFIFYIWRMNAKWYLGTLVVVLALFGLSLKQNSIPNQEIVVQFTHDEVTSEEAHEAMGIVKEQLRLIGAHTIQVLQEDNGGLKITYYSDIDVDSIEELFSKENLDLGYIAYDHNNGTSKLPVDSNTINYKLNVSEIDKSGDNSNDLNGYVVELRLKSDRFYFPSVYFAPGVASVKGLSNIENTTFIAQRNCAMAFDTSSHNIPEVRAGPLV